MEILKAKDIKPHEYYSIRKKNGDTSRFLCQDKNDGKISFLNMHDYPNGLKDEYSFTPKEFNEFQEAQIKNFTTPIGLHKGYFVLCMKSQDKLNEKWLNEIGQTKEDFIKFIKDTTEKNKDTLSPKEEHPEMSTIEYLIDATKACINETVRFCEVYESPDTIAFGTVARKYFPEYAERLFEYDL